MKEELQQIAQLMAEQLAPINKRLDSIDGRLDSMNEYAKQTCILLEKQERTLHLITVQHKTISQKLDKFTGQIAQIDNLNARLSILETVVLGHTAKLIELEKARSTT